MLGREMPLPDVSRLLDYPAESYRALARRLRDLGLTTQRVAPIVKAVLGLHPVMRAPVREHHLRRIPDAAGLAMRALLFADPITDDEARAVFGAELDALLGVGLLVRREGGEIVSPFVLSLINDLFILSDELSAGGEGVMGFGDGTIELCRAAAPDRRKRNLLDLGCGAGTCGLVLAAVVDRVVATDINPRAMTLARVNARLCGVQNIEFREGDSFRPVPGETFDIVACQPPFVSSAGGAATTFLDGGQRGDELALAMIAGVREHLTRAGRAVFRVDWPEDGTPLEQRLRAAAGAGLDLLLLRAPGVTPEEHATAYAAGLFPQLGAPYEEDVARRLRHLEGAGVRGLVPSFVVLQRAAGRPARTDVVEVAPLSRVPVTGDRIDKLFAARALEGERGKLLAAKLRVPEGTVLSQEQVGPGADVPSKIFARVAGGALAQPLEIEPEMLFLATAVNEAPDVRSGIAAFAESAGQEPKEALEAALPKVREALLGGLLEVSG